MLPKPELAYFAIADISGYTSFLAGVELRSGLIKSTIQERRRGRQRPGNFAPACRSGLRCA